MQPIDFFPTIGELAGIDIPEGLHSRSIIPALANPTEVMGRDAVLFGLFGGTFNLTDGVYAT